MTCASCSCNDITLELLQTLQAQIQSQNQQNNLLAQIVDQNNQLITLLCDDTESNQDRDLDEE